MKTFLLLFFVILCVAVQAQEDISYQKPDKAILDLIDVPRAPLVSMDNEREWIVFRYRDSYKSIKELSEEELRLAGLRINPKTNIGSRVTYYNNLKVQHLVGKDQAVRDVEGLPEDARLTNFVWSPDQHYIAFTNTGDDVVTLWLLDVQSATAKQLSTLPVNANLGDVINWFADSHALLLKTVPSDRKPLIDTKLVVPTGPTVSENEGQKAQNRTYQDLLKNPNDEFNFEQLALSEIVKVDLDGTETKWLPTAMYDNIRFSPDGGYVLVSRVEKPFSYIVPYSRFPEISTIYTSDGELVKTVLEVPLLEELPQGFMACRAGMRDLSWRADKPASLIYAVALDGGDPEKEVEFRDEVFELDAPFSDEAKSLLKTINRYSGIVWGNDQLAIATDYWRNNRNTKTYVFNPSDAAQQPIVLFDRNYQDVYSDPGRFVTNRNQFNREILALDKDNAFLTGAGYTAEGQFPFLDKVNLKTKTTTRLYQSELKDKVESILDFDVALKRLVVRIESPTEYPNYFFRRLKSSKPEQITFFQNPFKSIEGVYKEVIKYKRADGLELSGTLYLPAGYDRASGKKLPMLMWAYPREFKDRASAGQTTSNPNEFTYPYYGSPILWLTKGYAVLDDASFPIVGEGDEEPNDTYIEQLVSNAKAAIDAVDSLGYIDCTKVAVGGHSYGAFMVANLLTHSDLFAAGIARSGAYNRTLTPFGFQGEERNYWEAPEVYYEMSPFMHADKMKYPLLMIHGEADNNSGTYPMQSERYFNALKGLGATVRLVMLPKESHGYAAKESILHVLWEQDQWLKKYVAGETE
ncbi:alpha/beta hydrolase family protein [Mangrovibacterium diazotrophicum]|uniref:Dipeptidyl aminopeptidase/acylaminoacyl peptidase n=1 Tax=Mangrovibacterium diazotrophicum TaxID=1261403 RepID=A0A419W8B2_9BACT|nr:prolyl oligopeptidase family serine peptidase [Mangrovibacterium diazotrophicum]RKD91721.1 dipeptidyl aminopeptidase/acylaminoacyl peptidase [Mangrovibacterium diazotrophicum]